MVKQDKNCVFCKIISGEIKQEKIMESDSFIAVLDIKPTAKGHALVIPKQHYVTLLDIPNRLGNEMIEFTKKVASDLLDKKLGDGFNLVMNNLAVAGQVVMHAHIHVIPRKDGDGLRFLTRV
ncbi:HIT domain-containing protein [Candidatus Pacearchaeota archaeon]|nr:HIT domain-containing protein [Candidatus Pacearchaeota archaeon]